MLDSILKKEEIIKLLEEIVNNPKYYSKKYKYDTFTISTTHEEILVLFYDALYKYVMVIEDLEDLPYFIRRFRTLLERLDTIEDIERGISNIIGKLVAKKLDIYDIHQDTSKQIILNYIYEKYVIDGYYILGVTKRDYLFMMEHGLKKNSILEDAQELIKILEKYHIVLEREEHGISFTSNFGLGCLASINSPIYLSSILLNDGSYYLKDYQKCLKKLEEVLEEKKIKAKDKKQIMNLYQNLWNYYNSEKNNIYLVLIKRNILDSTPKEFTYNHKHSLYDGIYKIFSTNYSHTYNKNLTKDKIILMELSSYYPFVKKKKKVQKQNKQEIGKSSFDKLSLANIMLIFGNIFIIVGVLATIMIN